MRNYSVTIWFYFLGWLLVSSCHRGSKDETLLLKRADSLMCVSPDSALLVLKSMKYSEKLSRKERADYAIFYSRAQDKLHIRQTSDSLIREAVNYYAGGQNEEREMQAYYYWGCANKDMRNMELAVNAFLNALKVIPIECEKLYLGAIYVKLAACYEDQDLYTDALAMYRKVCEVYRNQNDEKNLFYGYRGVASEFYLEEQLDSSLCYYQKALSIAKKYNVQNWHYMLLGDIARIYNEKQDYQKAYLYISLAIDVAASKDELWSEYFLKGRILKNMHQLDSARYYFRISKNSPNIYGRTGSYSELYELEKEQRNFPAAIAVIDSFILLSDSIHNTSKAVEVVKMMSKYDSELKRQQLLSDYKIKLLVLISICVFILVIFLLKDRRSKNKIIKLQVKLNKLNARSLQEISVCDDDTVPSISGRSGYDSFEKYFIVKLDLCLQLYKETYAYRRICALESDELYHKIRINNAERQKICEVLYETFNDLVVDLKLRCASLTRQDMLYCIFFILNSSKYVILLCTGSSEGAFKTRKSRIKEKLGDELFKLLVNKGNTSS